MGREVCYCNSCGHRLLGDDVLQGGAFLHEGRRYCGACRPTSAVPAAAAPIRKTSSGRLRAAPPARRNKESTRVRRRSRALIPGLAAAAVVLVGLVVWATASPAEPPPPAPAPRVAAPPPPPVAVKPPELASVDELLEQVRAIREGDLMFARRTDVLRLYGEAAGRAGARKGEVDRTQAEYERQYEEAAARLADFTRSEALRLAARQKLPEALAAIDAFPEAFRASRSAESLRAVRADLERRRSESAGSPREAPPAPRGRQESRRAS